MFKSWTVPEVVYIRHLIGSSGDLPQPSLPVSIVAGRNQEDMNRNRVLSPEKQRPSDVKVEPVRLGLDCFLTSAFGPFET